jgi:hypothetical protein
MNDGTVYLKAVDSAASDYLGWSSTTLVATVADLTPWSEPKVLPVLMTCCGQRYEGVTASVDHVCRPEVSPLVWPIVDVDLLEAWELELLAPEWVGVLDTREDESRFEFASDNVCGDLSGVIQEARGWMADCGVPRPNAHSVKAVMIYIETRYDGGLGAFASHNQML